MSITDTLTLEWELEGSPVGDITLTGSQTLVWELQRFREPLGGFRSLAWKLGTTGDTVLLVLIDAPTGLVGTLTVAIVTYDGSVYVHGPTQADIQEIPAGTGRYVAIAESPEPGRYFAVWDDGGGTAVQTDLVITRDGMLEMRTGVGVGIGG